MRHLGLFEGIGGFSLAARWAGFETLAWVEINSFCQSVLKKHFPNAKGHSDIKEFDGTKWKGKIDLLTGGFPCQPFSVAGKREGTKDDRYLWEEMFRIIREVQPSWIVGENVAGLASMDNGKTLEKILLSLEGEGYQVQTFNIPACSIGAWHKRERLWIIANHIRKRAKRLRTKKIQEFTPISWGKDVGRFEELFQRSDIPSPLICRNDDGFSRRVDRLRALGNAIVPQVAFEIFKAIQYVNENQNQSE